MNTEFSKNIKKSINGDEYYSPQNVVDMIVPYIQRTGYKTIWCKNGFGGGLKNV